MRGHSVQRAFGPGGHRGTFEWVAWFNQYRLLEPIGYIPPAQAEANYYWQLASQTAMVAA